MQQGKARRARQQELWALLRDPDPGPAHKLAKEVDGEHRRDEDAVEALTARLRPFASPAAVLACIRARLATLSFELWCRREQCRVALSIEHNPAAPLDMLRDSTTTPFHGVATLRLRGWLDRLMHAIALGAQTPGQLDRRTAVLLAQAWETSCFVGKELLHFNEADVNGAFDAASAGLRDRIAGTAGRGLLDVVREILGAWKLRLARDRLEALTRAQAAAQRLQPVAPAEFIETLTARLEALKRDQR